MDIIVNLLSALSKALTPSQFVMILLLVAVISWVVIVYVLKNLKNKMGIWAFIGANEEPIELKDLKDSIDLLNKQTKDDTVTRGVEHAELLSAIQKESEHSDNRVDNLTELITELQEIRTYLDDVKLNITEQIDSVKSSLALSDQKNAQQFDSQKSSMISLLDMINRMHNQVDKIDEYVRAAIPEFKQAHRDLTRDLSALSRDVALVERSIQTQISSVNAVKLR